MAEDDGYITFPFQTAELLKAFNGDAEAAIQFLNDRIVDETIPFPFRALFSNSPEVMMAELKAYTPHPRTEKYFMKGVTSKVKPPLYTPYLFRGKPTYISSSDKEYATIDDLSDLFIEHIRLQTHRPGEPSVMDFWTREDLRREYLNKLIHGNPPDSRWKLPPTEVIDYPSMRNVLYYTTFESKQFRPTWAKSILSLLGVVGPGLRPKDAPRPKILDISAGWGDRLLTAMAIDADYLGFDPDTELKEGHDRMIQMFGDPTRHRIIYKPFEEATAEEIGTGYDVMLTSPPYFTTELYPGQNQSTSKFPDYVAWMNGFLYTSLLKAWNALKEGGYFAIHISDPEYPKGIILAEPTNLFIEDYLPGSSYEGVIGVAGEVSPSRPSARPVWIWQKLSPNSTNRKRWNPRVQRTLNGLYPDITHGVTFPLKRWG